MSFRSRRILFLPLGVAVGLIHVACGGRAEEELDLVPLLNDIADVVVEELGTSTYVDPSPGKHLCGTDVASTYAGESIAHGLTADSELPRELVEAVENLGWPIEAYGHHWFGEYRIVGYSATCLSRNATIVSESA